MLELFDREFETHKRKLFLKQIGFEDAEASRIGEASPPCLEKLLKLHARLERRRSSRGRHRVPDGLSWNAVYCMRDVLRELPQRMIDLSPDGTQLLQPDDFYKIALSDYASRKDRVLTPYRRRLARNYQKAYIELCDWSAERRRRSRVSVLAEIAPRAVARNAYGRMTGDGLTHATRRLTTNRGRLAPEETYRLIMAFAKSQQREDPSGQSKGDEEAMSCELPLVRRIHRDLQRLASDYRESL